MGDSLTLTVGDVYYDAKFSSANFPDGARVYGYVDSINYDATYGNVWELDETNNLWPDSSLKSASVSDRQGQVSVNLPPR